MQLEEEEGREALVVGVAMGGGEGDSTAVGYKKDHSLVAPPRPREAMQRGERELWKDCLTRGKGKAIEPFSPLASPSFSVTNAISHTFYRIENPRRWREDIP